MQTKLYLPPSRSDLVPRPNLIEILRAGAEGRLTLVSAPAGFGKTTLVASWISNLKSAWVSLDENDNDPARFLTYLVAALQTIDPEIGGNTLGMLQTPQTPPAEILLNALINDLAKLAYPVILVLDDYHLIHTLPIHKQIAYFLEHQPPHIHLVMITREDPLLPLSRLRARNQLTEIRQDDLRFSPPECADFLQKVMGLKLSAENVAALERRTEGWIAGLQLAAISMQGRDDLDHFVKAFTGSSRFVLDYLMEEVFENQPLEIQDFLLKTSILARLSEGLCNAVAARTQSQTLLEEFERTNLFIVALDQSRTWYRYHRLFAELLRHRLRSALPAEPLHQRASQWYEAHGFRDEAIQHALAGEDWGRAAGLVGQAADGLLKRGEYTTLIYWFKTIPDQIIRSQPGLGLSYVWALLLQGQFDEAESLLSFYEEIGQHAPVLMGQVATAQAYAARSRGNNPRVIEKSELALELLPKDEVVSRSTLALNLGLVYWHEGRLQDTVPALTEAQKLAAQIENRYCGLTAKIFLARTLASQGALRQSEKMLQETLQAGGNISILALAHYDLSGIYFEWNQLEKAWAHLKQGLVICARTQNVEFEIAGLILKTTLLLAEGKHSMAQSEADSAHKLALKFGPDTQTRSIALQVKVALKKGDVATAKYWAEQIRVDIDTHSFYRFVGLTPARLLLAQNDREVATAFLKDWLRKARQAGWGYATVAILTLLAVAAETQADGLLFLKEVLTLSQPEGFTRTYIDAGESLIPLLKEAAQQGIMPEYIGQILNAFGDKQKIATAEMTESLSARELEVLRLVTAGLSNREIAEKLILSPGTIKTHVHNICGKLGVRNRTEAATRATELKIV